MNNNAKGAIVVGVVLGAVGLAYYFLVYKKDGKGEGDAYSDLDNFTSLQTNLGLKDVNNDGVISVPFNNEKNKAQFYKNNRVFFFDKNNKVVAKGSYSNGGQSITLDNGKEFNGLVWQNIIDVIDEK